MSSNPGSLEPVGLLGDRTDDDTPRAARWPSAEHVLVAAAALLAAIASAPNVFGDDAAITFRYVERLARGEGFTYNAHERVLGTSNPLYALLLALPVLAGVDVEDATRALGVAAFVAAALLATWLTRRFSGSPLAGAAAGLLVVADHFSRYQMLSGMESGLSVALGLGVVAAVVLDRPAAAGALLGLAVWNKLDAGLLALAVTVAWLAVKRRFPLRIALVSVVTVLPWLVFASWYYGSPIPHSLVAKSLLQERAAPFDHWWIWTFVTGDRRWIFAAATLGGLGLLRGYRSNERLGVLCLAGWFVLHAAVFSAMSLGDYYPWYLTVLGSPPVILACAAGARLLRRAEPAWARAAVAVGLLALLYAGGAPWVRATLADVTAGNPIKSWEALDDDRRLAGIFLDQYAEPDEIVAAGWGWPAFESKRPFNDFSLLNSKVMREPVMYHVVYAQPPAPGERSAARSDGYVPLATFNLATDLYPGQGWFTVLGRVDSSIARSGARYLQHRLFDLPPPTAESAERGLEHVKVAGADLAAHPPSGATFSVESRRQRVHVVFTPAFSPSVAADKTDGATFEVWAGGTRLYGRHVVPGDSVRPAVLEVPGAARAERVAVTFVTTPGPRGSADHDWAVWKSVKVVVGSAFPDWSRLKNPKLMVAWGRTNPTGTSDRADQAARLDGSRPAAPAPAATAGGADTRYGGAIDAVSCKAISGWIWASATPGAALAVEILIDDRVESRVDANRFRKDLRDAGLGTGNYGFAYSVPPRVKDGKPHTYRARVAGSGYDIARVGDLPSVLTCRP